MNVLEIKNLNKSFGNHQILKDVSLEVKDNEFYIITGESGCGKSTLLNIIGMLDVYDSGQIRIFDQELPKPFSRKAEKLLKEKVGYLFQNFALIDNETVKYNLEIIMEGKKKDKLKKIQEVLKKVGLKGYENKRIYECSGGQQQRIALSRLLLKPCALILADEPTGSLDAKTKQQIIDLLLDLQKEGRTIIMVSHDQELFQYATHIYHLPKLS